MIQFLQQLIMAPIFYLAIDRGKESRKKYIIYVHNNKIVLVLKTLELCACRLGRIFLRILFIKLSKQDKKKQNNPFQKY